MSPDPREAATRWAYGFGGPAPLGHEVVEKTAFSGASGGQKTPQCGGKPTMYRHHLFWTTRGGVSARVSEIRLSIGGPVAEILIEIAEIVKIVKIAKSQI